MSLKKFFVVTVIGGIFVGQACASDFPLSRECKDLIFKNEVFSGTTKIYGNDGTLEVVTKRKLRLNTELGSQPQIKIESQNEKGEIQQIDVYPLNRSEKVVRGIGLEGVGSAMCFGERLIITWSSLDNSNGSSTEVSVITRTSNGILKESRNTRSDVPLPAPQNLSSEFQGQAD